MHQSRAASIAPATFFVAQFWADRITNMPGLDLRQAQECCADAAGMKLAIERGWLWMHESRTNVKFTGAGAALVGWALAHHT